MVLQRLEGCRMGRRSTQAEPLLSETPWPCWIDSTNSETGYIVALPWWGVGLRHRDGRSHAVMMWRAAGATDGVEVA
jgi:hypothetical protein